MVFLSIHVCHANLRNLQARSSAWLERHLDMVEVVGSIPIAPTKLQPHWMALGIGHQIGVGNAHNYPS